MIIIMFRIRFGLSDSTLTWVLKDGLNAGLQVEKKCRQKENDLCSEAEVISRAELSSLKQRENININLRVIQANQVRVVGLSSRRRRHKLSWLQTISKGTDMN